jgi:uncharacterized membrane protein YhaH (DUF805 family)
MNLETFTSFQGRIRRKTWWLGLIVLMIAQWVLMLILGAVFGMSMMPAADAPPEVALEAVSKMMVPLGIIFLVFLWPSLALYTKRWHDRNKSGWWSLIILIPIIGGIWALIEQGFLSGTEGPNDYGSDPKA